MNVLEFLLAPPPQGWARSFSPNGAASIDHPESWEISESEEFKLVSEPGGVAVFAIAAQKRPGLTLEEFAEATFAKERQLQAQTPPFGVMLQGAESLARNFAGTLPGDVFETFRIVLCAKSRSILVTLSLTTSTDQFRENEALYHQIQQSLRVRAVVAS